MCYTFTMRIQYLILVTVLVGCTPIATYPPIETNAALKFSNSANEPVPTIMATAITHAHDRFGGMDKIVFNLPVGVGYETYAIVADQLGGASPMKTVGQPAYHIVELRVRGFVAEADLVFPTAAGGYKRVTIHMETSFIDPWIVTRDRIWEVPMDEPIPNIPIGEIVEVHTIQP